MIEWMQTKSRLEHFSRLQVGTALTGEEGQGAVRVLGNFWLYPLDGDTQLTEPLKKNGFWEEWVTTFVARTVKPGWVVANIGAHVGYYTCLLALLVGREGSVLAVEPQVELFTSMKRAVKTNRFSWVDPVRAAIVGASHEGDTVDMLVPPGLPGVGSLQASSGVRQTVPAMKLTDLLARRYPLDFIFIDIEGAEQDAFEEAEGYLREHKPDIVTEWSLMFPRPYEFCEFWKRLGYKAHEIDEQDGGAWPCDLTALTKAAEGRHYIGNVWLTHPEKRR